jgi:DNA-binding MarR family transcriptional regulator
MRPETETSRKKLLCTITPKGREVYEKVMQEARRAQAKALLVLSREERTVLFQAIEKLQNSLEG